MLLVVVEVVVAAGVVVVVVVAAGVVVVVVVGVAVVVLGHPLHVFFNLMQSTLQSKMAKKMKYEAFIVWFISLNMKSEFGKRC